MNSEKIVVEPVHYEAAFRHLANGNDVLSVTLRMGWNVRDSKCSPEVEFNNRAIEATAQGYALVSWYSSYQKDSHLLSSAVTLGQVLERLRPHADNYTGQVIDEMLPRLKTWNQVVYVR